MEFKTVADAYIGACQPRRGTFLWVTPTRVIKWILLAMYQTFHLWLFPMLFILSLATTLTIFTWFL